MSENLVFPPGVYIDALQAELERATDPKNRAEILAELARVGVRAKAVAPARERR